MGQGAAVIPPLPIPLAESWWALSLPGGGLWPHGTPRVHPMAPPAHPEDHLPYHHGDSRAPIRTEHGEKPQSRSPDYERPGAISSARRNHSDC